MIKNLIKCTSMVFWDGSLHAVLLSTKIFRMHILLQPIVVDNGTFSKVPLLCEHSLVQPCNDSFV